MRKKTYHRRHYRCEEDEEGYDAARTYHLQLLFMTLAHNQRSMQHATHEEYEERDVR